MWSQNQYSPSTQSQPDDPMRSLGENLQRLGLGSQSSASGRSQSADGISQSNLHLQPRPSTPDWSHAHPEPPSAPRGSRVYSFDFESDPVPTPNFGRSQWSDPGVGNTRTPEELSLLPSTQQQRPAIEFGDDNPQSYIFQPQPDLQHWTGSCLCGIVQIIITGPPIITFICHCRSCKKTFGSDFVSLARYGVDDVNTSSQGHVIWFDRNEVTHFFCGGCGAVFQLTGTNSREITIPIALLDDSMNFVPRMEINCAQKALWLPDFAPPHFRYDYTPLPAASHVDWSVPEDMW
ncbi:Mss4-like protein [Annulohypoxylon maeteangense]|uniref:Mss4-like protein n=1 Tax=Annulohypoxylon maeteangense TaxID=1927788 RepID=UPI002007BF29|nr:Mss4-like protein [Annulohypoxylon maeteangense]KAI0889407.1 Mss4-like protein [Annulohypoxylon maeteangense]